MLLSSIPLLSFPNLFFLFSMFCFPNIILQGQLSSHLLREACLDPYSKMSQVSFDCGSYAPFNFECFSLIENQKQNRS